MHPLPALPPLSVYVHIPWCVRKCPYCDFNSHAAEPGAIPEAEFLKRVKQDIEQDSPLAQGRKVETLFFGGGTPSLLSPGAIETLLNLVEQYIGFTADAEITLEANPGTFEAVKFAGYRSAGVNRLSLGIQSFQDGHLKRLGRIHNADNARQAITAARQVGFDNFNIDLMHGLPAQTPEEALSDLQQAIDFQPRHVSWYQLTIEQNTEFYRQPPTLPEDETLWSIQEAGQQLLTDKGYEQYEVSAFAAQDSLCRHNLNYWQYGDYLGIGPGAHGKYSEVRNHQIQITRTRKTRLPKDYLNTRRPLVRMEEIIAAKDLPFDYFINALRLKRAVSLTQFSELTGINEKSIAPTLDKLIKLGWLVRDKDFLHTTDTGFLYLNDLLTYWLAE